jgi:ABC-type glycerol-3-phosphate transport system substrate-binding protein
VKNSIIMHMRRFSICVCLIAVLFSACNNNKVAQIWTDHPEFALYGDYFNSSQNQYKVIVKYLEYPSAQIGRENRGKSNNNPDIVVGSWLKNTSTGVNFKSLDYLFGANKLSRSIFYPRLLAVGRIDRSQYLLPVSFNVPALIFSKEKEFEISSPFTIGFEELKKLSGAYNILNKGSYTRMGFSPLWNDDFLMVTAVLFDSSFKEASPLAWDNAALNRSMDFVNDWTIRINTDNQAEEDFTFKYFIEPQEKLIQSGRILFSYMESSELFTLSEESKNILDFRWIMEEEKIPIAEDVVLLGIPKRGKAPRAAKAFVQWFFKIENQRLLLEFSKANRISETVFGICGGFSSIGAVTEQIFPRYYPSLLGRMPPSEFLAAPNILPGNWAVIRERVVLPYLHDRARSRQTEETLPLEKRLAEWQRVNR